MLLPALQRARETAKKSECMNNMGQLAKYLAFYADENKDHLLPTKAQVGGITAPGSSAGMQWIEYAAFRKLWGTPSYVTGSKYNATQRHRYYKEALCPSSPNHFVAHAQAGNSDSMPTLTDYAYNGFITCNGSELSRDNFPMLRKLNQFRIQPSKLTMLMDQWRKKSRKSTNTWSIGELTYYSTSGALDFDVGTITAHPGGANQLFGDGHVATYNAVWVTLDGGHSTPVFAIWGRKEALNKATVQLFRY